MIDPIVLLVNPAAGGGRGRTLVNRAYAALRTVGPVEIMESERPGDESRLAAHAANQRTRALVVLGGDGAVSHAARGLMAEQATTPLAVLSAGTGNDFVKSLRTPSHDYMAMAQRIGRGTSRAIDAGSVNGASFVNSAGFGFDVDVLRTIQAKPSSQTLSGAALYGVTAVQQLFQYKAFNATLTPACDCADGAPRPLSERSQWMTMVFAKGQWFGGSFRIAPSATLDNGLLDIVAIRDLAPLSRAALFARALGGAHIGHSAVRSERARQVSLTFDAAPFFQCDGELHQAHGPTMVVRCLPQAFRVIL
jgi:diacylglycerol kinase (ATP)